MTDGATVYSYVLIVTVYGVVFAGTVRAVRGRGQLLGVLTARPGARAAFFRNSIVNLAMLAGITVLIVALHPGLTPAEAGWAWPAGDGLGYLLTGCFLVLMILVRVRSRRGALPLVTAAMLPRTTGERWLAAGASVAVGVGEEAIYRGLLLAIGTDLLGLPVLLAAAAGLAVFTAAHAYQGWLGMITVALLGALFTALYLTSMSLLLPIVAHTCWDAMVLLLLRSEPASEAAPIADPGPRPAPTAETASASVSAEAAPTVPGPGAAAETAGTGLPGPEGDVRIRLRAAAPADAVR
ncbi:CPBP family intramembrane metalloprotease [Actinoplanes sp. NEAU-A12]|uniref:CPBP family intramembrane metalloprotease n=1 Tax=Actinoplanes sandaracinus TaxID=3045177 RepID=A0ABT6WQ02_9ACTN|nr:CPBP family intramembrane glutamic endopeptidase [Actinoplanes sandaracinus]MDI6101820.1 CPBP family intramembrane metalloprotease [Actinoplanes sandaracinus]